jgi:hypothetical protein
VIITGNENLRNLREKCLHVFIICFYKGQSFY